MCIVPNTNLLFYSETNLLLTSDCRRWSALLLLISDSTVYLSAVRRRRIQRCETEHNIQRSVYLLQ